MLPFKGLSYQIKVPLLGIFTLISASVGFSMLQKTGFASSIVALVIMFAEISNRSLSQLELLLVVAT